MFTFTHTIYAEFSNQKKSYSIFIVRETPIQHNVVSRRQTVMNVCLCSREKKVRIPSLQHKPYHHDHWFGCLWSHHHHHPHATTATARFRWNQLFNNLRVSGSHFRCQLFPPAATAPGTLQPVNNWGVWKRIFLIFGTFHCTRLNFRFHPGKLAPEKMKQWCVSNVRWSHNIYGKFNKHHICRCSVTIVSAFWCNYGLRFREDRSHYSTFFAYASQSTETQLMNIWTCFKVSTCIVYWFWIRVILLIQ